MVSNESRDRLLVRMIGGFEVEFGGRLLSAHDWPSRRSAELVQLLSLTEGHRLSRDQVMEALWPHLGVDAAAANLRKAAFHARRALDANDGVALRGGMVSLLPGGVVTTDLEEMSRLSDDAIRRRSESLAASVFESYPGELLAESRYEEWTQRARDQLHATRLALLRTARRWEELIELDPMREEGYRELMSEAVAAGQSARAVQLYGRLRTRLAHELSISPSADVEEIYAEAVGSLTPPPSRLVGRQEVLATAATALRLAEQGRLRCLTIRGTAGLGKTRLSREVQGLARDNGWVTVDASCIPTAPPYQPLISIVEEIRSVTETSSLSEDARSVLEMLMAKDAHGGTISRHRVLGAVEAVLSASSPGPILIALDDVHAADEATADVLMRWLGVENSSAVLVLMAYESTSLPDTIRGELARLRRMGKALEVELESLTDENIRTLVEHVAPGPVSEASLGRILALSGGNPALASELASSIDEAGDLHITSSTWESALTWSAGLDDGSVAMLQRLALSSAELTTDQVVAATGLPEIAVFELLDRAVAIGVLEVAGGRFRFREELVRQALCRRLPPHRRQSTHRDLARRLSADSAATSELVAHHWIEGGRPEKASPLLLAAARRAFAIGAFADCLRLVETLRDHEPSNPEALVILADALAATGSRRAVTAFAEAVVELDDAQAQEVKVRLALTQLKTGDPRGALETLATAEPTTLRGRICEALTLSGAAAVGFGDPKTASMKADEARRLALEAGEPRLVVEASWALSLSDHALGALETRLQMDLTRTAPLEDLAISVFDGHLCATERLLYGARPYDEVIDFAGALHDEAVRLDAVRGQGFALTLAGEAKLLAGRLDEAGTDLDRAVRLHRSIGASAGEALALQRRGEVAIYAGDREFARSRLERALSVARRSYLGHHLLDRIYGALITLADDVDQANAAREEAERAVRGPFETCPACRITLEIPSAIAAARSRDLARAVQHADAVRFLSEVMVPLPAWRAAAEEVSGHLADAEGNVEASRSSFRSAAELYRVAGQPLDVQRCERLAR